MKMRFVTRFFAFIEPSVFLQFSDMDISYLLKVLKVEGMSTISYSPLIRFLFRPLQHLNRLLKISSQFQTFRNSYYNSMKMSQ